MKITINKQKFFTKNQLVAGECYSFNGLFYVKAVGDIAGVVCLNDGYFTKMDNIATESFVKVEAELVIK